MPQECELLVTEMFSGMTAVDVYITDLQGNYRVRLCTLLKISCIGHIWPGNKGTHWRKYCANSIPAMCKPGIFRNQ